MKNANLWRKAARMSGVQTDFIDANKKLIKVPLPTLKAVVCHLNQKKIEHADPLKIIEERRERKIFRLISPVLLVHKDQVRSTVYLPENTDVRLVQVTLKKENGESHRVSPIFEKSQRIYKTTQGPYQRWQFSIKENLDVGYHQMFFQIGASEVKCLLLVPPKKRKMVPDKLQGLFAPLYAMHSSKSWGLGDLRDLNDLQVKAQSWGVDFIGTLPLLANFYEGPHKDISPYSPCSKLFWNEIYLYIPDLLPEGFKDLELQNKIQILNATAWVDYESVFRLKKNVLSQLAEEFFKNTLPEDYLLFLKEKPLVKEYAQFRSQGRETETQYHLYVQYHMERQMALVGKHLYLDYPVGVHPESFDCAYFSDYFLKSMSVGAPPDIMFTGGQNWGFNPLDPIHLRELHYEYFIQTLRHHMKKSCVLRLDHVMALHRLYVIPANSSADCGAYLRYNGDELFAIVAIEAYKNNVLAVGENLGTVPDMVQEYLLKYEISGMWLMVFEGGKNPTESIKKIPPKNLAAFSTHDMLPFAGFVKKENTSAWRRDFFEKSNADLFPKMMTKMAESPAEILLINIEDLWLEDRPQNIPGRSSFPNWQRKLKYSQEQWTSNPDFTDFIKRLKELRNTRRTHADDFEIGRLISI
ncbi:hypothetical protein AZI86_13325 [Bdellovibrio bacteriovorus]|uniref:4-alpha-glucanotransferase n=1 Tax=Bdellovibrio bacteriovorus TaxID=959 RepID=A0A150WJ69_BDEBC|nr:4-alpha-glucanotransferase [Bdellovibrio bacteriovorus]KYG63799.1 hypothetical protein AZI86_13325 [Bdellovibrio bacteriovorus]